MEESTAPVVVDGYGNLSVTLGDSYVIKDYPPTYPAKYGNILVDGNSYLTILNSTLEIKPDSFINVTAGSTLRIENSVITIDINSIQVTYELFFQIQNSVFEIIDYFRVFLI